MKIINTVNIELSAAEAMTLKNAYSILESIQNGLGRGNNFTSVTTGELIGEVNILNALGLISGVLMSPILEKSEV